MKSPPTRCCMNRIVCETTTTLIALAVMAASACRAHNANFATNSHINELAEGAAQNYEAESIDNTKTGLAVLSACSFCSGGAQVGWIGTGSEGTGSLRFNGIHINTDGDYDFALAYSNGGTSSRTASVSIDGGATTTMTFASTGKGDLQAVGIVHSSAHLVTGDHTFLLSNDKSWAPDIDRLTIKGTGGSTPELETSSNGIGTGGNARPAYVAVTGAPGSVPTHGYTDFKCEGLDPDATTQCLQAALDGAASRGQALILPSGAQYTISSVLRVATSVVGAGTMPGIHTNNGGQNWSLNNILEVKGSNLWISNLHLSGVFTTGSNQEFDTAIILASGSNITVSGNLLENTTGDGLALGNEFVPDGVVRNVVIDGNTFRNNSRVGIFGNLCDGAWIGNNVFVKPWAFEPSIDFEPNANPGCQNVEVAYNSFNHDRTPRYADDASAHAIFAAQHNNWSTSVTKPGGNYFLHHNFGPSFGKSGFWGYWTDGYNGFIPNGNPATLESNNREGNGPP